MKTLLMGALYVLIELTVLVVLPLVLLAFAGLLRFTVVTVLPVAVVFALAVASGAVRTVGVGLFLLGAALRVVMAGIERVGAWVPVPRFGSGVAR
ncbi:hypothetical protein E1161_08375 [Saccharopolyspora aridisoli]|uniref:Uncharacterized protein n=1 Tax=Saccharopolyspora aridisoli TaxID=2530385 RepID=A0A4R4V3Z5_9PSEU|nr:hypothetical protein [Saccharopolyspora aridisoli]TDC94019.1 hypothetical protein E1161_08375 [Saccharopolyspora aridisoli]